jgi:hypothetical protein
MTRAGPGPRLSTGRIRVDAARAIAKLRDYQLVDRRTWVLEGIRAAAASGATRIRLDGDADDVWLAWEGAPWPNEALPALFDELVSPEPARASQHLRLLGTAVNSALGLGPAHVDVIAVAADGTAARVRYTPDVLAPIDPDAGDATPLRRVAVETIERPARAPAPGMLVHLRRRVGLGTLANFVRGEPPELAIARDACGDAAVPVVVDGVVHGRAHHTRDLLRVPLGESLDAFLALEDPANPRVHADHAARLDIAEHGVILARYALPLPALAAAPRAPLAVRVFVDAPRMPTNASRSEVRRDSHPITAAEERARALAAALVEQLVTELADAGTATDRRARLRHAALALLAGKVAGSDWTEEIERVEPPLAALAALPLVEDALGQPRPVARGWQSLEVNLGAPYPAELAPWLDRVIRVPAGDPAALLFGRAPIDGAAARRRAKRARKALRAMEKFRRHKPRAAVVTAAETPRVRLVLGGALPGSCGDEAQFAGLTGQVCVYPGPGPSEIVLLHEGRHIETVACTPALRLRATIGAADLRPTEKYRGVVRNYAFARVEAAVRALAVRAVEALELARAGTAPPNTVSIERAEREDDAALMRRAFSVAADIHRMIGAASPLYTAPIWPTSDGRMLALGELETATPLGVITPGLQTRTPRGRIVLALDAVDRSTLEGRSFAFVDYGTPGARAQADLLDPALVLARGLAAERRGVALAIRGDTHAAAVASAFEPRQRYFHVGRPVEEMYVPKKLVACEVWIDDETIVPEEDWAGAQHLPMHDLAKLEEAYVRAIAAAVLGDAVPDLVRAGQRPISLDEPAGAALCAAIAEHGDPDHLLTPALATRLRDLRVATVTGDAEPRAIAELAQLDVRELPYIERQPDFPCDDWHVLVAPAERARAFARLAGRDARDATPEVDVRRRAAARAGKLAALRRQPAADLAAVLGGRTQVPLPSSHAEGWVGIGDAPGLVLHVHVERRRLGVVALPHDLPLAAAIDVVEARVDDDLAQLREGTRDAIAAAARSAVPALIAAGLAADPARLVDDPRWRQLLFQGLRQGLVERDLRAKLVATPMFRTIQGGVASIEASIDGAVRTATWTGDWLGAAPGEPANRVDGPVLALAEGEAGAEPRAIVQLLSTSVTDLTEAVSRLQTKRRVARGLIPAPTVTGADRALTRRLDTLGPIGERLGPGEIALVNEDESMLVPHRVGVPRPPVPIDVRPTVYVAVEAPELGDVQALPKAAMTGRWSHLQPVATQLVKELTQAADAAQLPAWARRRIRAAVLGDAIHAADIGAAPLFETTANAWVTWQTLLDQVARFGSLWYTAGASDFGAYVPLAPDRLALRLGPGETIDGAVARLLALFEASTELDLDAQARANQGRPRATAIALAPHEVRSALADPIELDDAGGRRGYVVPLAPTFRSAAGVRAHKDMFPFDPTPDVCAWPTLSVVEDPKLTPGRTWAHAAEDAAWQALVIRVREASDRALRAQDPPPDDAIASRFLSPRGFRDGAVLTGWVWLPGPSDADPFHGPSKLRVRFVDAVCKLTPSENRALRGWLAVTTTDDTEAFAHIDDELIEVHRELLHDAAGYAGPHRETALAHVALGLLAGHVKPDEVSGVRFPCFAPAPMDAGALVAFLGGAKRVPVVGTPGDARALVEDGGILSRVLVRWVGARAQFVVSAGAFDSAPVFDGRYAQAERGRGAADPADAERGRGAAPYAADAERGPGAAPYAADGERGPGVAPGAADAEHAAPPPPHPLQGLADAVWSRLVEIGIGTSHANGIRLDDRAEPLVSQHDGIIELAAYDPRLTAIEGARLARSAWADDAVEALVAHVVTALNVGLESVTDAAEGVAQARLLGAAAT